MNENIHDVLERTGDYLKSRTAEYREQPVAPSLTPYRAQRTVARRLLVGVGAVATLCGAVLVGSFVGGTNGRQVNVAQAAWSAVPAAPTAEQDTRLSAPCSEAIYEMFIAPGLAATSTPASLPEEELKPLLTEMRGTTFVAVYARRGIVSVCVSFADGSFGVNSLGADEFGTSSSFLLDIEDEQYMFVTGLLGVETATNVIVKRRGQVDVFASTSGNRYAAWMPGPATYTIEYSSEQDGSIREIGPFVVGDAPDGVFEFAPQTTIVGPLQG